MKELKTLKDLIEIVEENGSEGFDTEVIFPDTLRQEAIKWIKELKKEDAEDKVNLTRFFAYSIEEEPQVDNLIDWIKHFFTITEEELKEVKV